MGCRAWCNFRALAAVIMIWGSISSMLGQSQNGCSTAIPHISVCPGGDRTPYIQIWNNAGQTIDMTWHLEQLSGPANLSFNPTSFTLAQSPAGWGHPVEFVMTTPPDAPPGQNTIRLWVTGGATCEATGIITVPEPIINSVPPNPVLCPGETKEEQLFLVNWLNVNGSCTETDYEILVTPVGEGDSGISATVGGTGAPLLSGDIVPFPITVTAGPQVPPGDYTLAIEVRARGAVAGTAEMTVTIREPLVLLQSVDAPVVACRGSTVYVARINNPGQCHEKPQITLSKKAGSGDAQITAQTFQANLNPNGPALLIPVDIPQDSPPGLALVEVTANVRGEILKTETWIQVPEAQGQFVMQDDTPRGPLLCPGQSTWIGLKNVGQCRETFQWRIKRLDRGPVQARLTPGNGDVALGPGAQRRLTQLTISPQSPAGRATFAMIANGPGAIPPAQVLNVTVPPTKVSAELKDTSGCVGATATTTMTVNNTGTCNEQLRWLAGALELSDYIQPVPHVRDIELKPGDKVEVPVRFKIIKKPPTETVVIVVTLTGRDGKEFLAQANLTVDCAEEEGGSRR